MLIRKKFPVLFLLAFAVYIALMLSALYTPARAQDAGEPAPTAEFATLVPTQTADVVTATPADTVTPDATEVAVVPPVATDEPPVVVVNNPPATPTENGVNASTLLYGLIIALLGGGSFAFVLGRLQQNKAILDAGETLFQGNVSPEMQQHIRQAFEAVRDINNRLFDLVDKITDGKPNEVVVTPAVSDGASKADVKAEIEKQLNQALNGAEHFQIGR